MTVIITGASSGIGLACAKLMGATQPIIAVSRDSYESAKAAAESGFSFIGGDVRNSKTAARAVERALLFGSINTLICSAGIGGSGPTEAAEFDTWDNIFDTNVNGCFHFVRACLPEMLEAGRGTIILIASLGGIQGIKRNAAYSASKHAVVGFAKSIAVEHGKRGIVCVPVCPGFVDTPMTDRTLSGLVHHRGIDLEAAKAVVAATNPQNRIIPAEEVAEAVAFIASGKCNSLSGSELILTGGA